MKEVVDLYAKLVIATFSFMGPSFTLLIPLFYKAIQFSKRKHESRLKFLTEIIKLNADGGDVKRITSASDELKQLDKKNKKELKEFNPKLQAKKIFIGLIISIIMIEGYYFQGSHFIKVRSAWIDVCLLIISLLSFTYSITILWQVFCTIIQAKMDEQELDFERKNTPLKRFVSKPSQTIASNTNH